jgi:UDP-N-acetylglucosamine transferase subunit ALG13
LILFTVGTHDQPFDRLVHAAAAVARRGERVVVQRGSSRVDPGCEVHDHLGPAAFEALIREARVVVSHAGPSTLDRVLAAGRVPIVVPRDPARGEHVDDHQIRYATALADRLHVVLDPAGLPAAIDRHAAVEAARRERSPGLRLGWNEADPEPSAAMAEIVGSVVQDRARRTGPVRATLARLAGIPRK